MEALNVLIVPAIVKLFDMFNKKEWVVSLRCSSLSQQASATTL